MYRFYSEVKQLVYRRNEWQGSRSMVRGCGLIQTDSHDHALTAWAASWASSCCMADRKSFPQRTRAAFPGRDHVNIKPSSQSRSEWPEVECVYIKHNKIFYIIRYLCSCRKFLLYLLFVLFVCLLINYLDSSKKKEQDIPNWKEPNRVEIS